MSSSISLGKKSVQDINVLDVLKELMTESQVKFYNTFTKNGFNMLKTCKELGTLECNGYQYLEKPIVKKAIEIIKGYEDKSIRTQLPTLEFTVGKLMDIYEDVEEEYKNVREEIEEVNGEIKEISDKEKKSKLAEFKEEKKESFRKLREEKSKLLKQITDFQNKFLDMIEEDKILTMKMSNLELIQYAYKLTDELKIMAERMNWYDK